MAAQNDSEIGTCASAGIAVFSDALKFKRLYHICCGFVFPEPFNYIKCMNDDVLNSAVLMCNSG